MLGFVPFAGAATYGFPIPVLCGTLTLDAGGSRILPHERTLPHRTAELLASWESSGVQETPLMLFAGPDSYVIADGHHRFEAACQLAANRGSVTVAAAVFAVQDAVIHPAHRVIWRAPRGWMDECRRAMRSRLKPASDGAPVAFASQGELECFELPGATTANLLEGIFEAAQLARPSVVWTIEKDRDAALANLNHGAEGVILMPRVSLDDVLRAAHSGVLLPPRSTNFHPKFPSGELRFALDSRRLIARDSPASP